MLLRSVLAVLLLACMGTADPCAFPAGSSFIAYNDVMACLRSFPFNATVARHTLAQLSKAYTLYPFLRIAAAPPDPEHFSPPVDLLMAFKQLSATTYDSDLDFQEALKAVFLQLHDAHTAYWPPTRYRYKFVQPLTIASYVAQDGDRIFEVVDRFFPGIEAYYANTQNVSLAPYVGARLLAVDGIEAMQYFQAFAKYHLSTSKDEQTRFNLAFYMPDLFDPEANLGYWSVRWWRHHGVAIPTRPSHTYELVLRNGTMVAVTFNWLAQYANAGPVAAPVRTRKRAAVHKPSAVEARGRRVPQKPVWRAGDASFAPIINSTINGLAFYQIDARTMVWAQNTFEPQDLPAYYQCAIDALLYAKVHSLDRLILDMSNNGGGDLCLGRAMLQLLFPESPNHAPTDMPVSKLSVALTQYAVQNNVRDTEWSPSFYADDSDPTKRYSNNDSSWLVPGISRGARGTFSRLIQISPSEEGDELGGCGESPFGLLKPYQSDRIVVLTRGLCGSTCALFSDVLSKYDNVRTVVLGGVNATVPQSYRSFPGLQVMDSDSLYEVFDQLGQNTGDQSCVSCAAPRRLLNDAQYRMCIREIYRDADTLQAPSEYLFQPADFHLDLSRDSALHVNSTVWTYVASNIMGDDAIWASRRR